jgi:hypothetical protein
VLSTGAEGELHWEHIHVGYVVREEDGRPFARHMLKPVHFIFHKRREKDAREGDQGASLRRVSEVLFFRGSDPGERRGIIQWSIP